MTSRRVLLIYEDFLRRQVSVYLEEDILSLKREACNIQEETSKIL